MKTIEIGLKKTDKYIVRPTDTAKAFDSGALEVLATPVLICSAERSCKNLVQPLLDENWGTVGTLVNIRHLAPTPVGMEYQCECEIIAVEGRMIRFHVILRDETEIIGEGTHERFVINNERFTEKASRKMTHATEVSAYSLNELAARLQEQIETAAGSKALEFGSGKCSLAQELRKKVDYLACTDKSDETIESLRPMAEENDIQLIPDRELAEDCYFGRFHLVYTLFGFRGLTHLVDEIMRLRRLMIKGGKMVIIDLDPDHFAAECEKQLKRCGFLINRNDTFEINGKVLFLIEAEK